MSQDMSLSNHNEQGALEGKVADGWQGLSKPNIQTISSYYETQIIQKA